MKNVYYLYDDTSQEGYVCVYYYWCVYVYIGCDDAYVVCMMASRMRGMYVYIIIGMYMYILVVITRMLLV